MKKILWCCLVLAGLFPGAPSSAADRVSVGLGSSVLYNGLGANISFMEESALKYVALGCTSLGYTTGSGTYSNCGIGVGWMRSDILSENDRHGLGIHIGATYNTEYDRNDTEAFIGVPYAYFFRGMTSAGWHLGVTPIIGKHNDSVIGGLMLNAGYQF